MKPMNSLKKKGYLWVTGIFFLLSLIGHWVCAWPTFVDEQKALGQSVKFDQYVLQTTRDTLENWQSEFLQLIWQVSGLAYLLYVGSPQSKESSERAEEKLEWLMRHLGAEDAERVIQELDGRYPKA